MRTLVLFLLFVFLVLNYQINSTAYQYVCAALIVMLGAFSLVFRKGVMKKPQSVVDYMSVLMLFTWFYGVFLGILMGNKIEFVMSNFAGMSLYILYYVFLVLDVSKDDLFKVVFFAAIINISYSIFAFISVDYGSLNISNGLNGLRFYYSIGLLVLLPVISVLLGLLILGKKHFLSYVYVEHTKANFLMLLLAIFTFVCATMSKGFFLALCILAFLLYILLLLKFFLRQRLSVFQVVCLISVPIMIIYVFTLTSFAEILIYNYSDLEGSNAIRSEQAKFLIDEFSFFGSGLGGVLDSGYMRSGPESAYGFELSYHSLIHKIGIVSIIPFFIYGFTFVNSLYWTVIKQDKFYPVLCLGVVLFLVPSYGNPMLFSPIAVLLHCVGMYWLRPENKIKRGEFSVRR